MSETASASFRAKQTLELALIIAATLSGLAYVIGLLIVNIHLAHYGIVFLDLTQARYVTVGSIWMFWAILSTISLIWFEQIITEAPVAVHERRVARIWRR